MQNVVSERSFERITKRDLERLATIAIDYFDDLFERKPLASGRFSGRLLLLALCQGAALHYVDRKHGIKDFDVWGFFRALPDTSFQPQAHGRRDFGASRFGRYPGLSGCEGRRVDLFGRSIDVARGEGAVAAVCRYVAHGPRGSSPWHLARRPVIAIHPAAILGKPIWLPTAEA